MRLFDDSFFGSNLYISLVILLCGVSPLRVLVLRTLLVYDEPPRSNLRSHTGERAPRYASLGYQRHSWEDAEKLAAELKAAGAEVEVK